MIQNACQIGLAAMDLNSSPEIMLHQILDTHSFPNLLTRLSILCPEELIIPKAAKDSQLYDIVHEFLPNCEVLTLDRKYFNETQGSNYIEELCIPGTFCMQDISGKYLCLAALAALLKYLEFGKTGIIFANGTLKVSFGTSDHTANIDGGTLINLEVISNLAQAENKHHSLFGVINHTLTPMGARILRISLAQPLVDLPTIETRLNCVEELLENEMMYKTIRALLPNFSLMDKLIGNLVKISKIPDAPTANPARNINTIIFLKKILHSATALSDGMNGCNNELLRLIQKNLSNEAFIQIRSTIECIIKEDTEPTNISLHLQTQQFFAVKPGINGLLDVARKTFSETIEDIYRIHREMKESNWENLQLINTKKRGYYLKLKKSSLLPKNAVQIVASHNEISFSTPEMVALNERQKESTEEILLLTNRVIQELLYDIRKYAGIICEINDSVALLDLLTSFATYVTLSKQCCRPTIRNNGQIIVKNARHPILEKIWTNKDYVPNNIYSDLASTFQILTGPNMSGKSTYIRQVALIAILAQIGIPAIISDNLRRKNDPFVNCGTGSFVPAESCQLRPFDKIFSRVSTKDSIEDNASTLMLEMREIAFILHQVTSNSLAVIDELGRGTNIADGQALAWSICEELVKKRSTVFFTTHFRALTRLEELYPNVSNFHCKVECSGNSLDFKYVLSKGSIQLASYGLYAAKSVHLPPEVIFRAQQIIEILQSSRAHQASNSKLPLLKTAIQIVQIVEGLRHSSLDEKGKREIIANLRKQYFIDPLSN